PATVTRTASHNFTLRTCSSSAIRSRPPSVAVRAFSAAVRGRPYQDMGKPSAGSRASRPHSRPIHAGRLWPRRVRSATLVARHGRSWRGAVTAGRETDVADLLLSYIEQTADLVGVVDENSRVLYLNEAARKRLGVGEAVGLTTADLFPPHVFARYYDEIRPALVRDGQWAGELPVLSTSGEAVAMTVAIGSRRMARGTICGLGLPGPV